MCSVSIYIVYDTFNVLILLKDAAKTQRNRNTEKIPLHIFIKIYYNINVVSSLYFNSMCRYVFVFINN